MITSEDYYYMEIALDEARKAYAEGEVPVGACIVCDRKVIARSHNTRENEQNALHHAEILVIDKACKIKESWRLSDCTIYVTLEPCLMCTGAIANARIGRVVFAAKDSIAGACGSVIDTAAYPSGLRSCVDFGVLGIESSKLISDFFESKRK